jgi:hypothetical protein
MYRKARAEPRQARTVLTRITPTAYPKIVETESGTGPLAPAGGSERWHKARWIQTVGSGPSFITQISGLPRLDPNRSAAPHPAFHPGKRNRGEEEAQIEKVTDYRTSPF